MRRGSLAHDDVWMHGALDSRLSPVRLMRAREDDPGGIRLRRATDLVRVRSQVYAPAEAWRALTPWERYAARVHAYALVSPDAVFALESAAVLLGLPVFGEPRDVHVFDADRSTSTRYGDVVVHTSADPVAVEHHGGRFMTTLAHTVAGLGRALPPAFGLAVSDAYARTAGAQGLGDVRQLAHAQVNPRGRRRLLWLCERACGDAESSGESVSRAVIEWLGFDDPELQREFRHEGKLDRSDFYWLRERIIGESDGYGKYTAGAAAEVKSTFVNEKLREDRLRRYTRGFARWDWADALRAYPLGDKLHRAGLSPRHPINSPALATLRHNRRSL